MTTSLNELMRQGVTRMTCPKCEGGASREVSFGLWYSDDTPQVFGKCYRAACAHFVVEDTGAASPYPPLPFEPRPLRLPYRMPSEGPALFGQREMVHDNRTVVWQLYDLNGRRTGHVTRNEFKNVKTYKEVQEPVYYSNGMRPYHALWVFEDPRSAALCPMPAVALLGTILPSSLLEHMKALSPRPCVFVALDPGAEDAALRVHGRFREAGFDAVFVPMVMDYKDMPHEMREELLETYAP